MDCTFLKVAVQLHCDSVSTAGPKTIKTQTLHGSQLLNFLYIFILALVFGFAHRSVETVQTMSRPLPISILLPVWTSVNEKNTVSHVKEREKQVNKEASLSNQKQSDAHSPIARI